MQRKKREENAIKHRSLGSTAVNKMKEEDEEEDVILREYKERTERYFSM